VTVIRVPFFMGSPIRGLETPEPAVELSPALPDGSPQARMAALYRGLAAAVADDIGAGAVPVVFAGDCVAAIGVLAGMQHAGLDPALAWFDAHGDFHTWQTTLSGFPGGMPLAMLVGRGEQTVVDGAGMTPLDERRVALVGARDLDPGEDAAVAASAMTVLQVAGIAGWDPPAGPLHVHVDLDVVDPDEMPAHNYPAPGGPSLAAMLAALESLAATGRIAAVSFSTWNPALPGADRAAAAGLTLALPFLAKGAAGGRAARR
jgi:arginase